MGANAPETKTEVAAVPSPVPLVAGVAVASETLAGQTRCCAAALVAVAAGAPLANTAAVELH